MKKIFCLILCFAALFSLFFTSCNPYDGGQENPEETYSINDITNYNYELKRIDGKYYIVFEDERYFMPPADPFGGIPFDSLTDMKKKFFTKTVNFFDLNFIKLYYLKDDNGIIIPDMENLYIPAFVEDNSFFELSNDGNGEVKLDKEGYSFSIKADGFSNCYFTIFNSKDFYQRYFYKNSVEGYCEINNYDIIKKETVEERNATIYCLSKDKTTKKLIEYEYKENGKEIYVIEVYNSNDKVVPKTTFLFGIQGDRYFFASLRSEERIPEEILKGFGIKPYDENEEVEVSTTASVTEN